MRIKDIRQDYLVDYCIWLSTLKVPEVCDGISASILSVVNDKRFAYHEYFTESNINNYLRAKKQASSTWQISSSGVPQPLLDNIPANVITIYDFLETLAVVSKTFKDIEALQISDDVSTPALIANALCLLTNDLPIVYERLQNLGHSNAGIQVMISPLFEQLQDQMQAMSQYKQDAVTLKDRVIAENQAKVNLLMPEKKGGLAFLSRATVLSSYLINELTELVESGDTNIDFDPHSHEILTLERRFNQHLHSVQETSMLRSISPFGKLAPLLYGEINKIMQATASLTEVTHQQAELAYATLDNELLAQLHAEVEALEENLGLTTGVLTTPFVQQAHLLRQALRQKLDAFAELRQNTHQLANSLQNPITTIANATVRSTGQALGNALKRVIPRRSQGSSTSADAAAADVTSPPTTPIVHSAEYLQNLNKYRLARYVATLDDPTANNREQCAQEFFAILKRYQAQSGNKQLQRLPENAKIALKTAYQAIQAEFARKYPKLDIDIVAALNHSQQDPLVPRQAVSSLDDDVVTAASRTTQTITTWASTLAPYLMSIDWSASYAGMFAMGTCITISAAATATTAYLLNSHHNQLQQVLACEDELTTHLKQQTADNKFKQALIAKRFAQELALDGQQLTEYLQTLVTEQRRITAAEAQANPVELPAQPQPLQALGTGINYQTVFGKLKALKYSTNIETFATNHVYPMIWAKLGDHDREAIFGANSSVDRLCPMLPFTQFHKDEAHVQVYKKMLNACYHFQKCLVELEKVDDLGEPAAWNLYGRGVVAWRTLMPILTDGVSCYSDLLEVINHPLLAEISQAGISALDGLDTILPFLRPSAAIHNPTESLVHDEQQPFDAKQAWLREQTLYFAWLNKTPLPAANSVGLESPTFMTLADIDIAGIGHHPSTARTEDDDDSISTLSDTTGSSNVVKAEHSTALNDSDTISTKSKATSASSDNFSVNQLATWIAKSAQIIQSTHQRLLQPAQADATHDELFPDERIEQQTHEAIDKFFKQLQGNVTKLTAQNTQHSAPQSSPLIERLRALATGSEAQPKTGISFAELQQTLQLLDDTYSVFAAQHAETTANFMQHLQFIYDVVTYKLLTQADDLELTLGLRPGTLSHSIQDHIDIFFDKVRSKYTKQGKYTVQAWSDNTLLKMRAERLETRAQQLSTGALEHNNPLIPDAVTDALQTLSSLQNGHFNNWDADFANWETFDSFLNCYQTLQPILCECNPIFDKSLFLRKLHNHRPDLLRTAIKDILTHSNAVIEWHYAQVDKQHRQAQRHNDLAAHIRTTQWNKRIATLTTKTLEQLVHDKFADKLGTYLPLLQQLIVAKQQAVLLSYLQSDRWLDDPLDNYRIDDFLRSLRADFLEQWLTENQQTWGEIIQTLEEANEIDKRYDEQIAMGWHRLADEKSVYRFALKPTTRFFIPEEHVIYLEYDVAQQKLHYTLLDPHHNIVHDVIDADWLTENRIIITAALTQRDIDNVIKSNSDCLLKKMADKGHTVVKNPCLLEKMKYMQTISKNADDLTRLKQSFTTMLEDPNLNTLGKFRQHKTTEHFILWRHREKKLAKYDKLITLFDKLNLLEAYYIAQNPSANSDKIRSIQHLKHQLADENITLQKRLHFLSMELVKDDVYQMLHQTQQSWSTPARMPSLFARKDREHEMLTDIYAELWPGSQLILLLTSMEQQLTRAHPIPGTLEAKKISEVQKLKELLHDEGTTEPQRLRNFFEHLANSACLELFMHHQNSYFGARKNIFNFLTDHHDPEELLIENICPSLNKFFDIVLILNKLEQHCKHQTGEAYAQKQQVIAELKAILIPKTEEPNGSARLSQEARLHHFAKQLSQSHYQVILHSPADNTFLQILKQLLYHVGIWQNQEEKWLESLQHATQALKAGVHKAGVHPNPAASPDDQTNADLAEKNEGPPGGSV